jgi:hypothetical protein
LLPSFIVCDILTGREVRKLRCERECFRFERRGSHASQGDPRFTMQAALIGVWGEKRFRDMACLFCIKLKPESDDLR